MLHKKKQPKLTYVNNNINNKNANLFKNYKRFIYQFCNIFVFINIHQTSIYYQHFS